MSDPAPGAAPTLRRATIAVALCYGVGAVATQALLARQFGHTPGFVRRLGELAYLPWLLAVGLALWAVALHRLHRRRGGQLFDGVLIDRAAPALVLLALLAIAPFLSAYASHAILPVLALIAALGLGATAALAPRSLERLGALLGHRAVPFLAAAAASSWYFVVAFYRHANFGSGSRDMGLFLQTVWLLSRGRAPQNTLIDLPSETGAVHAFGDHLELIDLLVAPVVWIWQDAGELLLVQAVVAGSAVAAVMIIAQRRTGDGLAALLLGASTFLAYPLAQAVQFDWNPTTLAAGFLAWAFAFADRRRIAAMLVALLLVGLCKENLWLYVAAFGVFLILDGHGWRLGAGVAAVAVGVFGIELKLIFPLFREGGFRHFYFKELGESFPAVAANAAASPLRALSLMVTPGNKVNGLMLPFTSTAWLSLVAPAPLVVALPGVAERFFSSFRNAWWGYHYGGPTAVVALVAATYAVAKLAPRLEVALAVRLPGLRATTLLALVCLSATGLVDVVGRWAPMDLFALEKPYLPAVAERPAMRRAVAAVPADAAVAAQNYFLAHLAAREQIYELDTHTRADVVVLNVTTSPWPYNRGYIERLARQLAGGTAFGLTFCEESSWVFSRGADPAAAPPCPTLDALRGRLGAGSR